MSNPEYNLRDYVADLVRQAETISGVVSVVIQNDGIVRVVATNVPLYMWAMSSAMLQGEVMARLPHFQPKGQLVPDELARFLNPENPAAPPAPDLDADLAGYKAATTADLEAEKARGAEPIAIVPEVPARAIPEDALAPDPEDFDLKLN